MKPIDKIQARLAPLRSSLLEHSIYAHIDGAQALHLFMEHHVFAVWDFMSLLKSLQQRLSCTSVPWLPPTNRPGCRLVNEIVLGEESDEDGEGGFASHFDLYHRAMQQCGASIGVADSFLDLLRDGASVDHALVGSGTTTAIRDFVSHTFSIVDSGNVCAIASAFAFGREDLLPDVFRQIVANIDSNETVDLKLFRYYLDRHIELDGDKHGPMAASLMEFLCGEDEAKWQIAEDAAVESLASRLRLWDAVQESIVECYRWNNPGTA